MRTAKELKELLQKHSEGRCTPEEEKLLQQWFTRIGQEESSGLSAADRLRMLNNFTSSLRFAGEKKPAKLRFLNSWRPVAVAAVLTGALFLSWLLMENFILGQKKEIVFVQLATGSGEVKQVVLPDSSVIWLNANTSLSYHPDFINHREIRLSGEALFEVTDDTQHPFTVMTADSVQTTVLGTQFNIRSYDRFPEAQITVLSGKVQVAQLNRNKIMGILTSNQAIHFDRSTNSYVQTEENAAALTGWRTGEWGLKDQGVSELALLLYNQYNVTVVNRERKLEALHLDANFTSKQSAREIVTVFCLLAGCRYKWKDNSTVELYY